MLIAKLLCLALVGISINPLLAEDATTAGLILRSNDAFTNITAGAVPYYKDNASKALAINAANEKYRGKFARAECAFKGTAGEYDVKITTLTEEDGECTYRLLINGTEVGTFQNPRVEKKDDSQPLSHVWRGITIPALATIAIESNSHSNSLIPENGGFAWARGRWRDIEITPKSVK